MCEKEKRGNPLSKALLLALVSYACWSIYVLYFTPEYSDYIHYQEVVQMLNRIERAEAANDYHKVRESIAASKELLQWCWQTDGWFEAGYIAGPGSDGAAWRGDMNCWKLSEWYMLLRRQNLVWHY